jgi:hyperosmotically inducible protein
MLGSTLKQQTRHQGKRMRHSTPALVLLATLLTAVPLAGCGGVDRLAQAGAAVDDSTITAGVRHALGRNAELDAAEIDVVTRGGTVELSGYVGSADHVATAASLARTVKGVKSVRNDLRLK